MERAFKGIWIPAEIWLNKDLKLIEKLFLVEIDSLDNKDGCFASNDYFSDFFGLSKNRCSEIIKSLENKGYITASYLYKKNTKYIEKRVLRVMYKYIRKTEYIVDKPTDIFEKPTTPSENCEDNNTSNNITNNSKYVCNEKLSEISKLYQENIGVANGIVAEYLIETSTKIDIKLFKRAIEICAEKGNNTFGYLKGIINNWLQKNVTSYEELKALELQNRFSNNSVSKNNNNIQKPYKKGAGANVNNAFAGYTPDELEKILLESQKGKFD
ncbi:DnaD domain protein [Terrisporobacter glycolicus]|uniref:DnaB/C C-terminal domain-containing protein n=1 Tax=Terrisporobacter glycolicus ATCC 14880 = DSM 1288 TaxID=1121315 RepID=A0ABZ2EWW1_9FIRM|nr:DnaD domain protein [Terrisporobacter glycolicus]